MPCHDLRLYVFRAKLATRGFYSDPAAIHLVKRTSVAEPIQDKKVHRSDHVGTRAGLRNLACLSKYLQDVQLGIRILAV